MVGACSVTAAYHQRGACKSINWIELLFIIPFICRELPFQKGDIVYIIRQVDQNWYEGEHHGRVGIFPQSYVEVCEFSVDAALILHCFIMFFLMFFLVSFSCFPSPRRPSQRKASRCRCWSTARQWPALTSVGTLWWKCLLERLEHQYLQSRTRDLLIPKFQPLTAGREDHAHSQGGWKLVWGQNLRHQSSGHLSCHLCGSVTKTPSQKWCGVHGPSRQPVSTAQPQCLSSGKRKTRNFLDIYGILPVWI